MNKGIKLLIILCFQFYWVNHSFAQNRNGVFIKHQLAKSTWYPMVFSTKVFNYSPSLIEIGAFCFTSENINNNEYLPGRYKDLTSLKHTVLQIHAPNHESLDFFIGFHL